MSTKKSYDTLQATPATIAIMWWTFSIIAVEGWPVVTIACFLIAMYLTVHYFRNGAPKTITPYTSIGIKLGIVLNVIGTLLLLSLIHI